MVEVVGTTLASIGLFLQIFDTCDRLYHGVKLTWRFGNDWELMQIALEVQWARLETTVRVRRIRQDACLISTDHYVARTIKRLLESMRMYFTECNKLMKWYDGEDNHGPCVDDQRLNPQASETPSQNHSDVSTSASTIVVERRSLKGLAWVRARIKGSPASLSPLPSRSRSRSPLARSSANRLETFNSVPFLESSEQNEVRMTVVQKSRDMDHKVNYFKKMSWAHRDMEALKQMIDSLRSANNDLAALVESLAIEGAERALPVFPQIERLWPLVTYVENVLYQLHARLGAINRLSDDMGTFHFSLQLFEDYSDNREDFHSILAQESFMEHPLARDASVFNLQKHASSDTQYSKPELLNIEVVPAHDFGSGGEPSALTRLSRPPVIVQVGESRIEQWGHLRGAADAAYFVFRNDTVSWTSSTTLEDILNTDSYEKRATPGQIAQLARLILCTHLYLERIIRRAPAVRPRNYRYYQQCEASTDWDEACPLFLSPYLSIGFGSRAPLPIMGARQGIPQTTSSDGMVEIGLILYQIGCGQTLEYGAGAKGLKEAKNHTLRHLHELDRRVGPGYSEIVAQFLEFHQPAGYLLNPDDERQASEQIKRAISALTQLDQSLANTVVGPFVAEEEIQAEILVAEVDEAAVVPRVIPMEAGDLENGLGVTTSNQAVIST